MISNVLSSSDIPCKTYPEAEGTVPADSWRAQSWPHRDGFLAGLLPSSPGALRPTCEPLHVDGH